MTLQYWKVAFSKQKSGTRTGVPLIDDTSYFRPAVIIAMV
jgi:hypothetical protein